MDLTKETKKGRRIGRGEKRQKGEDASSREKNKRRRKRRRMAEKKRRREVGKTRSRNEEKRTNVAVVFAEAAAAELTRSGRRSLLFFFAPPSLLPLEKYTESLLLSFLSEEEKEHRPKSLMRLEATRGELGRRSPLPVPLWGSLLLLFPHRNRLRNWRSRREGKNAQLVWFPKKKSDREKGI